MVQSTSLATAARYEEDTAAASGDKGVLVLVIRNDAGGTLVDASGDYTALTVDNLNNLYVTGAGPGALFTVVQPAHDLLNCNANIQVNDTDVSITNPVPVQEGLVMVAHDFIDCGYTAGNLTSVVYKAGGAGGATVATLALTYDGLGNLDTITKT